MPVIRTPLGIIRENLRPYLWLSLMAYGLLAVGLVVGAVVPDLNAALKGSMEDDGTTDQVVSLLRTPWLFALTIMVVNIGRIALAAILLPSLVVPFLGVAVFAFFAVQTGITLAPVDHVTTMTLIPHSLTMVIEFQAYVLLLLGAYLLGRSWIRPSTAGAVNRRRGYVHGLKRIGWLALPVLALFVIGAIYEALSLAYLVPLLLS
ncbi:hypothetical protein [Micromonospora sp. WMMD1155]|uniref:hypothetical protein n=1 Tax=Micromonospora sp. WMMD1155 TaxID=3016094 RepID=UPI00249AA324|nr:hypothetical protein [Micromonospora sp. WMMD1155]WFE51243.1 hypothetical protein O7617_13300 [Micromonospora sp. WMMD1155]